MDPVAARQLAPDALALNLMLDRLGLPDLRPEAERALREQQREHLLRNLRAGNDLLRARVATLERQLCLDEAALAQLERQVAQRAAPGRERPPRI